MYYPEIGKDGFRYYGRWGGNPKGTKEDKNRCIATVADSCSWRFYQCQRKRGYGKDKLFCKQHGKIESNRKDYNND